MFRYLVAVISFIYLIGITGSLELDRITCTEFSIKAIIALAILIVALWKEDGSETW